MAYIGRTPTGSILTGADIADGSISTAKINNSAVTTSKISIPDNDKLNFGTGNDLEIYHSSSASFIDETGTGTLAIRGAGNVEINSLTNESMANFINDGAVELFHNASKKLETASGGVNVTGAVRLQNATTGSGSGDGLLLEVSGNDVYFNQKEDASIFFRTNNTDRMKIDSSGNLLLGKTSSGAGNRGVEFTNLSSANPRQTITSTGTGAETKIEFRNGNGYVGEIFTNGSATTYLTSSDYRLKENVDYTFDATSRLKQLKPARFNFKADADTTVDGFLAHEVSSIVPEAISGEKDGTEIYLDDNGDEQTKPLYQGIDQSKLVPLLVKTIQELEARITELENA